MDAIDIINAQLDAAKQKHTVEKIQRDREFRRRLKQESAKKRLAKAGPAKHSEKWKGVYVHESAIERKFAPLGESDPSRNRLEWTRFDYKPTVPWKAVTSGRVFSTPQSDEDFLLSTGLGTIQNKSTTSALDATMLSPVNTDKKLASSAVAHPQPWRSSDAVSRLFSNIPPDRPLTFHEKKLAMAAKRPDRLRFKASKEVPAWKPTKSTNTLFSRYATDAEFQAEVEAKNNQANDTLGMDDEFDGIEDFADTRGMTMPSAMQLYDR